MTPFRPYRLLSAVATMTRLPSTLPVFPVCLLSLVVFSCAAPRVEEFEAAIGRSTQDELTRRFGYPQRFKRLSTGQEVWDYEFLSGNSRCVGYRVFFDDERRSTQWASLPCRTDP